MTREYKGLKQEIADLKEVNDNLKHKNVEKSTLVRAISILLGCEEDSQSILTELKAVITESSFSQGEKKQMSRDLRSKDRLLRVINEDPVIEAEAECLIKRVENEISNMKDCRRPISESYYEL